MSIKTTETLERDNASIAIKFNNKYHTESDIKLTWSGIKTMVEHPLSVAKNVAPCFAPHILNMKTKAEVEQHNSMSMSVQDIDGSDMEIIEVKDSLAVLGVNKYIIYSTASSMRLNKKGDDVNGKRWRIIIPHKNPIPCTEWRYLQEALCNLLDGDPSMIRVNQISYLSNNPEITDPRETRHYEYHIEEGEAFDLNKLSRTLVKEFVKVRKQNLAIVNHKSKSSITDRFAGEIDPITAYNEQNTIESELLARGDKPPHHEGGKWTYSKSESGSAGISVKDGKMYSHHESDPLSDGKAHDAFDLMMEHIK